MKSKQLLTFLMATGIMFSQNVLPTFAAEVSPVETTDVAVSGNGEQQETALVNYMDALEKVNCTVSIPKQIVLDKATKAQDYQITAKGNLNADTSLKVRPVDEIADTSNVDFYMHRTDKSVNDVVATVTQAETEWTNEEVTPEGTSKPGSVAVPDITPGTWEGTLHFGIGLYDTITGELKTDGLGNGDTGDTETGHKHNFSENNDMECDCGYKIPALDDYVHSFNGDTVKLIRYNGTTTEHVYVPSQYTSEGRTYNVEVATNLFHEDCPSVLSIAFDPGITLSNDLSYMFDGCSEVVSIDLGGMDTSNVTTMTHMFMNCSKLTDVNFKGINTSAVTDMSGMFSSCSNLSSIDLSGFDTSAVTDMSGMFSECKKLSNLDLSSFNTSAVKNMSNMFYKCIGLQSLDVSTFDTSAVTNMAYMFYSCTGLQALDVSAFDTSAVTNMSSMFSGLLLNTLDVSTFDTSAVTDMSYMFSSGSFTSLDVSAFDTSAVKNMSSMFAYNAKLTNVNVDNFNTASVTDMSYMFSGCRALAELDLQSFTTSRTLSCREMMSNCNLLKKVLVSSNWNCSDSTMFKLSGVSSVTVVN